MESACGNHFLHLQKEKKQCIFSLSVAGIVRLPLDCSKENYIRARCLFIFQLKFLLHSFVRFRSLVWTMRFPQLLTGGLCFCLSSQKDFQNPKKRGNLPTSCDCDWASRKFFQLVSSVYYFFFFWTIFRISITTNTKCDPKRFAQQPFLCHRDFVFGFQLIELIQCVEWASFSCSNIFLCKCFDYYIRSSRTR